MQDTPNDPDGGGAYPTPTPVPGGYAPTTPAVTEPASLGEYLTRYWYVVVIALAIIAIAAAAALN